LLLGFGEGGLLAWTATATPFGKPLPAALPVALDPPVDGGVVDAEHPRGLGLVMPASTARTARLRSAACAAAGNDRVSASAIPRAYDTTTPFACRSDKNTSLTSPR
jgi:hypothetical protein